MGLSTHQTVVKKEDWPYIWAIRDTEQLDWRIGLSNEEICAGAKEQIELPVEIGDGIFLSDARHAHDLERLKALGITHVLNVAGKAAIGPENEYTAAGITVKNIEADDEEGYPMLANHLGEAQKFISSAHVTNGRCVVHCIAGINRSGVIVAAVKMLSEKMNVLDVVAHCRRRRGNVFLGNNSFQVDLVALARKEHLLGPPPGEPYCRVTTRARPMDCFIEERSSKFNAHKVKGLFR